MVTWKIYYVDRSTFSSEDGTPKEAPAFGVITIVQRVEGGERPTARLDGEDFYYWVPSVGRWFGGDEYGIRERLRNREEVVALKQGRLVLYDEFCEICAAASNDPVWRDV
jgi:hypothetical protein